jgi:hypothetical protein
MIDLTSSVEEVSDKYFLTTGIAVHDGVDRVMLVYPSIGELCSGM